MRNELPEPLAITAKAGISDKTRLVLPYGADHLRPTEPDRIDSTTFVSAEYHRTNPQRIRGRSSGQAGENR
jgi:hypothetical protein